MFVSVPSFLPPEPPRVSLLIGPYATKRGRTHCRGAGTEESFDCGTESSCDGFIKNLRLQGNRITRSRASGPPYSGLGARSNNAGKMDAATSVGRAALKRTTSIAGV